MSREICSVNGLYFEYNEETHEVCSSVLPKPAFEQWYAERYMNSPTSRRQNYKDFMIRLARVAKKGTSSTRFQNLQALVKGSPEGSFSDFCKSIISKAEAPAEEEVKFTITAKEALLRIDREIENWSGWADKLDAKSNEARRAAACVESFKYVRSMLFGLSP